MSDEPQTPGARPGDPADIERGLERLHADSFAWALACCAYDRDAASEALQTAYLKVLDGRARFHGRSSLKTWFFAVVRTTAVDRRRRLFRRALRLESRADDVLPRQTAPAQPLELVERGQLRERLLGALRSLPRRQREVLELVFYQGLTIEQAAQVMAVGLGTARVHYQRGKHRMHSLVAEDLS